MGLLNIKLNQDYKSFKNGFETNLEWNLILISWVNWSWKSQLLDIIKKREGQHSLVGNNIKSKISLDWNNIDEWKILYKSIISNLHMPELRQPTDQDISQYKRQVLDNYEDNKLNLDHRNLKGYQKSARKAKEILIKKFWETKFNDWLTESEVNKWIPSDFIWRSNDIFYDFPIWNIFFSYAIKRIDLIVRKSKEWILSKDIDFNSELWVAPWIQFNELFKELNLEYRFGDYPEIENSCMNCPPNLYWIDKNWNILEDEWRLLNGLSDWEKAIISLIFWSLSWVEKKDINILLLDEFDATFNPSLTEKFYSVLEKYFVEKWILVILVTHSPATISLAPDYTSFYEIFKPNASKRIEPVLQESYEELKIANKNFYEKIWNQEDRIKGLEEENKNIRSLVKLEKPIVMVEWTLDVKYIKKAAELLDKKDILEKVEIKDGNWSWGLKSIWKLREWKLLEGFKIIILLYDCDVENIEEEEEWKFKRTKIPLIEWNLIKKWIENLFTDSIIKKAREHKRAFIDYTQEHEKEERWEKFIEPKKYEVNNDEKRNLCDWICKNWEKEDFKNFEKVFSIIEKFLI